MSFVTAEPQSLPPSLEQKAVPSPGQGEILRTEAVSTGLNWREILRPEIPQSPQNVRQMAEAMRQAQQEQSIEVSPQALTTGRYLMQEMGLMIGNICKDNNNIINIQTDSLFGLAEQLQNAFNLYGIKVDFTKPELVQQAVDQLFEKNPKLALSIAVAYSEKKLEIISKAYQITRGEKIEEEKKGKQEKKEQGIPDETKDKLKQLRTYTRKVKINLNTGEVSVVNIGLSDEELQEQAAKKGILKQAKIVGIPLPWKNKYSSEEIKQMLKQVGENIGEVGEFYLEFSERKDQQGQVIQNGILDENEKTFLQQLGLIEGNNRFTLTPQTDSKAIEKQNQFIANLASQITEITSLRGEFFRLTGLPQSEISKYLLDVAIQDPKIKAVLERIGGTPLTDLLTKIKDQQSQEAKRQLQERKTELTIQRLKARKRELEKELEKAKEREGRESGGEQDSGEKLTLNSISQELQSQLGELGIIADQDVLTLEHFTDPKKVAELRRHISQKTFLELEISSIKEEKREIAELLREKSKERFEVLSQSREVVQNNTIIRQADQDIVRNTLENIEQEIKELKGKQQQIEKRQQEINQKILEIKKSEALLNEIERAKKDERVIINGQEKTLEEWLDEYRRLKAQEQLENRSGQRQLNEQRRSVEEIQRDLNAVEVLLGYYSVEAQNARGKRIAQHSLSVLDWDLVSPVIKERLLKQNNLIINETTGQLEEPSLTQYNKLIRVLQVVFGEEFLTQEEDYQLEELGGITVGQVIEFLQNINLEQVISGKERLMRIIDSFRQRVNNGKDFDDLFRQPASKQSQP